MLGKEKFPFRDVCHKSLVFGLIQRKNKKLSSGLHIWTKGSNPRSGASLLVISPSVRPPFANTLSYIRVTSLTNKAIWPNPRRADTLGDI